MKFNSIDIYGAKAFRNYDRLIDVFGVEHPIENGHLRLDVAANFGPGLIVFTGPNGAGKTSLMELGFQPWPERKSHHGNYASNFYLRDSYRDISFEYGGHSYRSKILINAETQKLEAYLYMDDKAEAENKTGSSTEYKRLCRERFGSKDLYFKTVFCYQGSQGIGRMTIGNKSADITDFLMGLFDMERYAKMSTIAKNRAEKLESDNSLLVVKRDQLLISIANNDSKIAKRPEIEKTISEIGRAIETLESEILTLSGDIALARNEAESRRQLNLSKEKSQEDKTALLKESSESQNDKTKALAEFGRQINQLSSEIEAFEAALSNAEKLRADAKKLAELTEEKTLLDSNKGKLSELRAKLDKLLAANEEYGKTKSAISDLSENISKLQTELGSADSLRADADKLSELEHKIKTATESRQELANLKVKLEVENQKAITWKESIEKDFERLQTEHDQAKSLANNLDGVPCKDTPDFVATCPMIEFARNASKSVSEISTKSDELAKNLKAGYPGQSAIGELEAQIETRALLTPDDEDFAALKSQYDNLKARNIPQLLSAIDKTAGVVAEKQEQLEALKEKLNGMAPADPAEIESLSAQIDEIDYPQEHYEEISNQITNLSNKDLAGQLKRLDESAVKISERKNQRDVLRSQRDAAERDHNQRIAAIMNKLDDNSTKFAAILRQLAEPLKYDLSILESQKSTKDSELSGKKISLGECRGELNAIAQYVSDNETAKGELETLNTNIAGNNRRTSLWRLLETAFGKQGIQALEIREAGPMLSDIATELIKEFAREKSWAIKIKTERDNGDGTKSSNLDIMVSMPGEEKTFDDLSEGQKIWVEEAIKKAVIIYLIKHVGREYRTLVQDETDGALDQESWMAYLNTTEKTRELTGANHIILISHREAFINMISQQIRFEPENKIIRLVRAA